MTASGPAHLHPQHLIGSPFLSCKYDLFGTAGTARTMANRIPGAQLTIYPTGRHLWLGHDDDIGDAVSSFVLSPAIET